MELILAPKPRRSILFNKRNREVYIPWEESKQINCSPFDLDISPISSFMTIQENNNSLLGKATNNSSSLFISNFYAFGEDFKPERKNSYNSYENYENVATTEIIGILSEGNLDKLKVIPNAKMELNVSYITKIKKIKPIYSSKTNNNIKRPYCNKSSKHTKMPLLDKLRKTEISRNIDNFQ